MADLRERLALAICANDEAAVAGPQEDHFRMADAAIKLIVEECAKVARGKRDRLRMDRAKEEVGSIGYAFLDEQQRVADIIEAQIRALAKEGEV